MDVLRVSLMSIAGIFFFSCSSDDAILTGSLKNSQKAKSKKAAEDAQRAQAAKKENAEIGQAPESTVTDPAAEISAAVDPQPAAPAVQAPSVKLTEENIFDKIPEGAEQMKIICARPGQDKVRKVFCGPTPPVIKNLKDLQAALGFTFNPASTTRGQNGAGGNAAFAVTAHSSSLVAKFTSSINPRVIIFTPPTGNAIPDFVAMGFVRGEQFAEIIANDPVTNVAAFFLVRFKQACNSDADKHCSQGQLLSAAIEKDWTGFTLYEDIDLKNTIADCLMCHQPGGLGTVKMLRMQELRNPWTHFLRDNTSGGPGLTADYVAAKSVTVNGVTTVEDYGGIPGGFIRGSDPALLEDLIRDNGFGVQPNEFQTRNIEQQAQNGTVVSAAWQTLYDASMRGQFIPVPSYKVKIADPTKMATMTAAYQNMLKGTMPVDSLPDIRQVYTEDTMWTMGLKVKPGITGPEILIQACKNCHNDSLDQTITRAKFNVDLTKMNREEKDKAIVRLQLPPDHPEAMPPLRFRELSDAERKLVIDELKK